MTTTPRTEAAIIAADGRWTYELKEEMQAMERELAAANERIKRLEHAGDAMHRRLTVKLGLFDSQESVEWEKSKESKP